jgi:hypothetical protein
MKRVVRYLTLTTVGITAGVMLTAAPAYAALGTCHPSYGDSYFDQYCDGSRPTSFRAWVFCSDNSAHYGPWEWAGGGVASQAYCATNRFVTDFGTSYSGA